MQSTNTSSPQKLSTASPSKSIGPYHTIITTYAPFTILQKNSKEEDSPIKKVKQLDDNKMIKSTKLIKSNRELSKCYSKSQDIIIIKDFKDESQYIGSYNGKVREGFGKLFNAQGILIYEGQWLNDQQHGNGILYNNEVYYNYIIFLLQILNSQNMLDNSSLDINMELLLNITEMVLCMLVILNLIVEMEWDNQQKKMEKSLMDYGQRVNQFLEYEFLLFLIELYKYVDIHSHIQNFQECLANLLFVSTDKVIEQISITITILTHRLYYYNFLIQKQKCYKSYIMIYVQRFDRIYALMVLKH